MPNFVKIAQKVAQGACRYCIAFRMWCRQTRRTGGPLKTTVCLRTAAWPFVNGCNEFRTALLVWSAQNQPSATTALHSLQWLPVASRIKYKLCVLMFDVYHGTAPACTWLICAAAVATIIYDHQLVVISLYGGQGHASPTVRSPSRDLLLGTHFLLTSGRLIHTLRSAVIYKLLFKRCTQLRFDFDSTSTWLRFDYDAHLTEVFTWYDSTAIWLRFDCDTFRQRYDHRATSMRFPFDVHSLAFN